MSNPVSVPSVWPVLRTLTLSGVVRGAAQLDGSKDVALSVTMPDGSLSFAKVHGLTEELRQLNQHVDNSWSTGYTTGPVPTAFGGDLDQLIGATFVFTHAGTASTPDPENPSHFLILQNGPTNFGQQMALRGGELWHRSQHFGTWGAWRRTWSTADLDPNVLLLKTDVAGAAEKLSRARAFKLTGAVESGAVHFDGTGNVTLETTIAEGSLPVNRVRNLAAELSKRPSTKGEIKTGQALNTLLTPGFYVQPHANQALQSDQYPVNGQAGFLEVYTQAGLTRQIYTTEKNVVYRRVRIAQSWTNWARQWSSADFLPKGKLDVHGGEISGDLRVVGEFSTARSIMVPGVEVSGSFEEPTWVTRYARGHRLHAGLRGTTRYTEMALERGSTTYSLRMTDNGRLTFNDQDVWHQGTLDPSNPVPNSGLLQIGSGTNRLLLRADGHYSTDGGSKWRQINEAPQTLTDPILQTLRFVEEDGVALRPTSDGGLTMKVGATGRYRDFEFRSRGDLVVPGRILVGGNERTVWHEGTFNPNQKLDRTATAVAAMKLAVPRKINGVTFDGSQDITIRATVNPDEYIRIVQDKTTYSNANDLVGRFDYAISGHEALGTTGPYMATWNLGVAGNRDGQFSWEFGHRQGLYFRSQDIHTQTWKSWNRVWTDHDFSPEDFLEYRASLAPYAAPIVQWDQATSNGWYLSTAAPDAPEGARDQLLYGRVIASDVNNLLQEVWLSADDGQRHWVRHRRNGQWTAWCQDKLHEHIQLQRLTIRGDGSRPWSLADDEGTLSLTSGQDLILQAGPSGHVGIGTAPHPLAKLAVGGLVGVGGPQGGLAIMDREESKLIWECHASDNYLKIGLAGGPELVSLSQQGGWMADRLAAGWDSGVLGSVSAENWFRSTGDTGIYFSDYGGGVYMTDPTYVRTYNDKGMAAPWFRSGARGVELADGNDLYAMKIKEGALIIEHSVDGEALEEIDVFDLKARVASLESLMAQLKQQVEDLTSP